MSKNRLLMVIPALAAGLAMMACGSGTGSGSGGGNTSASPKGNITVAGFDFSESSVLAQVYGQALKAKGYTVTYKARLGKREVVEPALERGDIDFYLGYAATDLEFINKGKGEAGGDAAANVAKLNTYLAPKNLVALQSAPAIDTNAFVVTKATADKYHLAKLSDLAAAGSNLVLGGPAECPQRPFCQLGLHNTYGVTFKDFKALDTDGPLTNAALRNGQIDVALKFSSDSDIAVNNWVTLADDKQLESADAVTPIGRTSAFNSDVTSILNSVSAKLTTDELVGMNKRAEVDKVDADQVAGDWLKSKGLV